MESKCNNCAFFAYILLISKRNYREDYDGLFDAER